MPVSPAGCVSGRLKACSDFGGLKPGSDFGGLKPADYYWTDVVGGLQAARAE